MSDALPQLPLALAARADLRFDTFIGDAGSALSEVVAAGHPGAWLLTGGAGSGKTHLLRAACFARGEHAAYVALGRVPGSLAAVAPMFENKALLALDDVDAIAGRRDDEVALFNLHNRLVDVGALILYASRTAPEHLPLTLPDLRSRLAQATRLPLQVLDDAGKLQVLRARAQRSGLEFEDAAAEWLLRRFERDLCSLMARMDQLDQASLAAQRRLTVPFLRQVLGSGE